MIPVVVVEMCASMHVVECFAGLAVCTRRDSSLFLLQVNTIFMSRSEEESLAHRETRDILEELITESSEMLQNRPIRRYGARRHPPSDIRSFLTIRPGRLKIVLGFTLIIPPDCLK